jgi:hypothetical protein
MGILRDYLPFGEVPIKVYFQKRQSVEEGAKRSREEGAPDMSQVQVYAFDDDGNPIDPNEQIRQDSAEYESEDFLEEEFAEEFEEDEMQEEEFAEDEVVEIKGYDQHPDMPGKVELPDEESPDEESPDEESPSEPPSSKKPSSEKPTE